MVQLSALDTNPVVSGTDHTPTSVAAGKQGQEIFTVQIPNYFHAPSFRDAVKQEFPEAVCHLKGHILVLVDGAACRWAVQNLLDDQPQALGDCGDCGEMDTGDI